MPTQPTLPIIPDLVDNSSSDRQLATVLNRLLTPGGTMHVASGYFNLAGFALIRDSLNELHTFRLLLGQGPTVTDLLGQLRQETAWAMGDRRTPPLVEEFLAFLQRDTVQVRRCQERFFHGKAYLIEGVPMLGAVGLVGSSNFTAAGLTSNFELNAVHKQASAVDDLREWYERFWEEAEDYKRQLIELLAHFTEQYPPFLIYMKALFEYFKDQLDAPGPVAPVPTAIELTEFQEEGYRSAKAILDRYGGVLIADSVGLGKTHLGLRFLDEYAYRERQKALVVCPAQLRDTLWGPRLAQYRIFTVLRSQEELSRQDFNPDEFADCDLVLVDESHNFRSTSANRYGHLMRVLTAGKPKKLILMTATPVNNSLFDLYNQVRLLTRDNDEALAAVGIPSLWGYFLQADGAGGEVFDLLEEMVVRRTRPFIRRNYPNATINGEPIRFPDRELHTVHYRLEDTYAGLYAECAQVIEGLKLAPYTLEGYRKRKPDPMALGRQHSLAGLLQMLYLKRLESSVTALRISFQRQRDFQARFLELLRQGRLLDSTSYRQIFAGAQTDESGEDEPDLQELLDSLPEVDPRAYKLREIEQAVQADLDALDGVLQKIQAAFGANVAGKDAKLRQLKALLCGPLKGKKVVVFTFFKDTARYLYRELGGLVRQVGRQQREGQAFLRRLGHDRLRIVDSGVKPDERRDLIRRFSPSSNLAPHLKGTPEELDLLISTDVLSEGQNLQDADTVINYDLHWNPVRMIQRAGRIDRIGSPYEVVHLDNFFPEDRLDDVLKLMERLRQKIEDIRRTVGLDAKVLDPSELVNPQDFNALRDIEAEKGTIVDELEALSELDVGEFIKQELLDFLKGVGREQLAAIPDGVGSGLRREGERGLFVYLRAGPQTVSWRDEATPSDRLRYRDFWCYYDLTQDRHPITERKSDILKLIRCDEQTPRVEPDFDVYDLIDRCKQHVVRRLKRQATKPTTLKAPQNQVVNWLQAQAAQTDISDLLAYFAEPLPTGLLKSLRTVWRDSPTEVSPRLDALREFAAANPIAAPVAPQVGTLTEEELQLVCWVAVV